MSVNDGDTQGSEQSGVRAASGVRTPARTGRSIRGLTPLGRLRLRAFGIDAQETSFAVRGFLGGKPLARSHLEGHAAAFVEGFNIAISGRERDLEDRLCAVAQADRGFAYEGAAMAVALLDILTPLSGRRLERLLSSHGRPHRYMCHVGAGWALAVLRRRPGVLLPSFDPFIRWLATDGYGFHEGFFHTRRSFAGELPLRRPRGYEQRAFDQGLGRSLWFVEAADVDAAAAAVARFAPHRRSDLWSGLGLAAAYTTVATPVDLAHLHEVAGVDAPHVVQGAAFAVSARHEARNVVAHTRAAADLLCGASVERVADVVDGARADLHADGTGDAYEQWRTRIRRRLVRETSGVA